MTALIVYADTRRPQPTAPHDWTAPYLSDGDRRTRRGWQVPAGELWDRLADPSTHRVGSTDPETLETT